MVTILEWHTLVSRIVNVNLHEGRDNIIWSLHKNGSFTVRPKYNFLVNTGVRLTQQIWQMKIPLKMKIFIKWCYSYQGQQFWQMKIPLKIIDMFNQWSNQGGRKYQHFLLIGAAAFCWVLWLTRNELVFDKHKPKIFLQVLFMGHTGFSSGRSCSDVMTTN